MLHVCVTRIVTYSNLNGSKFMVLALYLQTSVLKEKWRTGKTKKVPTEPAFSGKQWWYQFNIRYHRAYFLPLRENKFSLLLNHLSSLSALLTDTGFPLALVLPRNRFVSLTVLLTLGSSWLTSLWQYCSPFISAGRIKPHNFSHGRAGVEPTSAPVRGLHDWAWYCQGQSQGQSRVPQWAPAAGGLAPFFSSPGGNSCFMSCRFSFKLHTATYSFLKSICSIKLSFLKRKTYFLNSLTPRVLYLTL